MPITVSPITPADIGPAARCIQIAFAEDPYHRWAFDSTKFDTARNLASLRAKCEWGIRNALFYVAKDTEDPEGKVIGISMWMKPRPVDSPQTWSEWADDYVLWFKQGLNLAWYGGRGGLRTKRYWIWKKRQAEAQSEIWTDPNGYYFCNIVTVLPGHQGAGIGKKLMVVVLDAADAEGRRCYLESSRLEPNVPIYEKMGFKLVKEMKCEEGGDVCDLFCMVREPQAKQTAAANDPT